MHQVLGLLGIRSDTTPSLAAYTEAAQQDAERPPHAFEGPVAPPMAHRDHIVAVCELLSLGGQDGAVARAGPSDHGGQEAFPPAPAQGAGEALPAAVAQAQREELAGAAGVGGDEEAAAGP
eukprot:1128208-Lingulodinium_polyedra.AAC.1